MSIGVRLREERVRLGMSQSRFAEIASVSKNTAINWERGASSPTAAALQAWSEAGADVAYIVTGLRLDERREDAVADIGDELAVIERELLDPDHASDERERASRLQQARNQLTVMLRADAKLLTPELKSRAESLLDLVNDADKLHAAQAAYLSAARASRDQAKRRLSALVEGEEFAPGPESIRFLATIYMNYRVPLSTLVNLTDMLHTDWNDRHSSLQTSSDKC